MLRTKKTPKVDIYLKKKKKKAEDEVIECAKILKYIHGRKELRVLKIGTMV